jgi:hypothetical protein
MATPPLPSIFIRPKPTPTTVTYTVNPNNPTNSSYFLEVTGFGASNYSFVADTSWYKYTVSNLTLSCNYSAQVYQIDSNGLSNGPVAFRTVQTGYLPGPVQNLSTTISGSSATLTWGAPLSNGGATVDWYVIRNLTTSVKYNTIGNVNNIFLPLSGSSNLFSVEAVNDPGYSTRVYNSTITVSPVAFNWVRSKYLELASNAVQSDTNVTDWDAYATSDTSVLTDVTITGSPQQTNLQSMFGMSDSSNPAFPVYTHMPHCLYTAANGTLYLFDGGNFGTSFGSYSVGDTIAMIFSGSSATYTLNGTTIYTKTFTPTTNLHLCATAGIANAQYSNITFINN